MERAALRLVAVLAAGFMAGLVVAGASGWGPLAYISYTINGGGSGGNNTIFITPAYLDLGELSPGMAGNATGQATVTVTSSGYYEVSLVHEGKLKRDFASFTVTVAINGTTITLSPYGEDSATVYLGAGTYNATINVSYIVKDNPQGGSLDDMPLLKFEYTSGDHEGEYAS